VYAPALAAGITDQQLLTWLLSTPQVLLNMVVVYTSAPNMVVVYTSAPNMVVVYTSGPA
jgi:hypothetical protein